MLFCARLFCQLAVLFILLIVLPVRARPFTLVTIDSTPPPTANIMWVDFDKDGDHDLIVTTIFFAPTGIETRMYRNEGGAFARVTDTSFTDKILQANSSTAADYDNDGDDDLFLGKSNFLQEKAWCRLRSSHLSYAFLAVYLENMHQASWVLFSQHKTSKTPTEIHCDPQRSFRSWIR